MSQCQFCIIRRKNAQIVNCVTRSFRGIHSILHKLKQLVRSRQIGVTFNRKSYRIKTSPCIKSGRQDILIDIKSHFQPVRQTIQEVFSTHFLMHEGHQVTIGLYKQKVPYTSSSLGSYRQITQPGHAHVPSFSHKCRVQFMTISSTSQKVGRTINLRLCYCFPHKRKNSQSRQYRTQYIFLHLFHFFPFIINSNPHSHHPVQTI